MHIKKPLFELWRAKPLLMLVLDDSLQKTMDFQRTDLTLNRYKSPRQFCIVHCDTMIPMLAQQGFALAPHDMTRYCKHHDMSWWRHQIETFSALLAIVRGIQRSPGNSPHKGQWRGALMFSLICVKINGWINNREAGDLRRYRAHYDVTVMYDKGGPQFSFEIYEGVYIVLFIWLIMLLVFLNSFKQQIAHHHDMPSFQINYVSRKRPLLAIYKIRCIWSSVS